MMEAVRPSETLLSTYLSYGVTAQMPIMKYLNRYEDLEFHITTISIERFGFCLNRRFISVYLLASYEYCDVFLL